MKKILVLFGGDSFEHAISCLSARTVLENIDRDLYEVTAAGISEHKWYIFNDNLDLLTNNTWKNGNIKEIDNIIEFLKGFDKIFPMIHGNDGENGNLQGLFNLFNIPYVGPDVLGSSTGYDKEITKIICDYYHIPQVPYITIHSDKEIDKIDIPYPVIIKPASCGSSIGINIANNIEEVNKYIKEAFKYDQKVLIEKFVTARELECGVLEKDELIASPVGEIKSANTFYDYEAKYLKESGLIIPAQLEDSLKDEIQTYAKKIFKVLSLKNLSRIDFLYDINEKKLYFNEVNTIPGFTSVSMYPLLFKESGISLKELITILLSY